jgi:hypothetical protein
MDEFAIKILPPTDRLRPTDKSKSFHAETQRRKGFAKKSFAGSLRLNDFA